jgi:flagellin-like protein
MQELRSRQSAWKRNVKRHARGVSPIIATILLVAITVVLAAVLYVLVSGLTRSGASTPYALGMVETSNSCGATTCIVMLQISPSPGLTTSAIGLRIINLNTQGIQPTVAAAAGCTAGVASASTACTATAGGWYAVVIASGGTEAAAYSGASASWGLYATGTNLALNGGYTLMIVTAAGNSFVGLCQITAYGVGASSVSGQANL